LRAEPSDTAFHLSSNQTEVDSSIYYFLDRQIIVTGLRAFVFGEGGIIFNGGFEGAGSEPSLNKEEYSQYYVGGGMGLPLFDWATISLAYRFMRLNVRTPCAYCPPPTDFYVVNTASVHSLWLKFGLRWEW
jgi:hypothetical protein